MDINSSLPSTDGLRASKALCLPLRPAYKLDQSSLHNYRLEAPSNKPCRFDRSPIIFAGCPSVLLGSQRGASATTFGSRHETDSQRMSNAKATLQHGSDTPVRTVGEVIEHTRGWGISTRVVAINPETRFQAGSIGFLEPHPGLRIHYSDATDLQSSTLEADCPPHIGVKVFLSGSVDARFGTLRLPMPTRELTSATWQPIAMLVAQPKTERFVRKSHGATPLRKVTVSFSIDWLKNRVRDCGGSWNAFEEFARCHLAIRTWRPSLQAIEACEQIITAPQKTGMQYSLHTESRALLLISEALAQLVDVQDSSPGPTGLVRPQDHRRLRDLDQFLASYEGGTLSAEDLAQSVSTSANTLRRLVRKAYGESLLTYARKKRLEVARALLEEGRTTITSAAFVAGYADASNFATAFKRQFGLSPSSVMPFDPIRSTPPPR